MYGGNDFKKNLCFNRQFTDLSKPFVFVTTPAQVHENFENPAVVSGGAKPSYDRQISRVRSMSVFSSESHIHRNSFEDLEDNDDSISLDFDILQENDSDEVL